MQCNDIVLSIPVLFTNKYKAVVVFSKYFDFDLLTMLEVIIYSLLPKV